MTTAGTAVRSKCADTFFKKGAKNNSIAHDEGDGSDTENESDEIENNDIDQQNALGEKGGDNYDDTQKVSSSEEESDADDADREEETKGEESPGLLSQVVTNVGNAMNAVKGAVQKSFDF